MFSHLRRMLAIIGPGIFAIGYTIGTGSVTSMAKAGSQYGLRLLWVLVLSCLFSGVLMEAFGRMAVVTGQTTLFAVRNQFRHGRLIAILILAGVVTGQYACLGGILTLSASALYETAALFCPSLSPDNYWAVLGIAFALITLIYLLLLAGQYSFFEKILLFFVTLMGLSFLISMFVVWPDNATLKQAVIPSVPDEPGAWLMIAAFVGTTMAAPTFVTRPLLLKEKGMRPDQRREQSLDALVAAVMMFIISGSIMCVAAGALYAHGKTIVRVLDMVHTLEPVAGKFAVALFMAGTLSAGISSMFPILMVAPLLIGDYRSGRMDTRSRTFRCTCLGAALLGLVVPVLGQNPIMITVMAQVTNVFVLPLTILVILILINRRTFMTVHRAGVLLNLGLVLALIFSCIIAVTGALALLESFTG